MRCSRATQMHLADHMRPAGRVFETPALEHRFLTAGGPWTPKGPWRGSRGSTKITKMNYCIHLSLFNKDAVVNQCHKLTLWGSMEFFFEF
jgi:hypothetical protein